MSFAFVKKTVWDGEWMKSWSMHFVARPCRPKRIPCLGIYTLDYVDYDAHAKIAGELFVRFHLYTHTSLANSEQYHDHPVHFLFLYIRCIAFIAQIRVRFYKFTRSRWASVASEQAPFTSEFVGSILATNSCDKPVNVGFLLVLRFSPTGKVNRVGKHS
jgi:hypothetical protein